MSGGQEGIAEGKKVRGLEDKSFNDSDNGENQQQPQTDNNLSTVQSANLSNDMVLSPNRPIALSTLNSHTSLFGFLNIYKPAGIISPDVVAVLRKTLKTKQIGHTGTLDPFAEGVLPIAIGKATRLIEYLSDDKEYIATVRFGCSTNTYDLEGETTFTSDKKVTKGEIIEKLRDFEGEIEQIPPIFSAIKVKGKKLYEYARKGEEIEIQPRKVTIYNIELKSFDENLQQAEILIKCSKGTYIRSIANDLGNKLGCGGHLIKLIRTQAGKFRIENSVKLEVENGKLNNFQFSTFNFQLINPIEILDLPIVEVDDTDLENIKNGVQIDAKRSIKSDNSQFSTFNFQPDKDLSPYSPNALLPFVLLVYNKEKICAVGQIESGIIKLKKVFL